MTDKDVLEKQVQDSIEALLDDLIKKGKPIYYWRSNAGDVWTIGSPQPFIKTIFNMFKQGKSLSELMAFAHKYIRKILLAPKGHPDYTACIVKFFKRFLQVHLSPKLFICMILLHKKIPRLVSGIFCHSPFRFQAHSDTSYLYPHFLQIP